MKRTHEPLEVGVRDLRADLAGWLSVAREREVMVTERGRPVARLVPVDGHPGLEALVAVGAVTPPDRKATAVSASQLLPARGPVSDLATRQSR